MSGNLPQELAQFLGMRIIASEYLPKTRRVQVRFPRSKRVRIRKKWRKDSRNWTEVDATGDIYMIPGNTAMVRPEMYAVLRNVGKEIA